MQLTKFRFCIFKQIAKSIMKLFISYLVPSISKIISWGTNTNQFSHKTFLLKKNNCIGSYMSLEITEQSLDYLLEITFEVHLSK